MKGESGEPHSQGATLLVGSPAPEEESAKEEPRWFTVEVVDASCGLSDMAQNSGALNRIDGILGIYSYENVLCLCAAQPLYAGSGDIDHCAVRFARKP